MSMLIRLSSIAVLAVGIGGLLGASLYSESTQMALGFMLMAVGSYKALVALLPIVDLTVKQEEGESERGRSRTTCL